jgi:hypothetical protein
MSDPIVCVSGFKNIYDTGCKGFHFGLNDVVTWSEFTELLACFSELDFPSKEASPLFCPTVFTQKRGANYATFSGMACIDTDHCDLMFDDIAELFSAEGFEAVMYTTASNQHGERYRVIVPFAEPVDPVTHDKAVRAICRAVSPQWSHDAGKSTCYSMFYFPGQYASAGDNRYVHLRGHIVTAEEWISIAPPEPTATVPVVWTASGEE